MSFMAKKSHSIISRLSCWLHRSVLFTVEGDYTRTLTTKRQESLGAILEATTWLQECLPYKNSLSHIFVSCDFLY